MLSGPVDWNHVLRLAEHHGVTSLLWQTLAAHPQQVPAAILTALQQQYQVNVRKSLLMARELFRILDCAELLGIELVPYKGLVHSELYYGDLAMRQSGDLDIFVPARDVMRLKSAVRELGYTTRVEIPPNAEQAYLASGYECTFDSPEGRNLLELQWALQPRFYAVDYNMDGLFARAVDAEVAGRRVKTPSAEDLLLVLSLHAAKHYWERLIWICDIARVIERGNINWDWVRSEARRLGIERILHVTLGLVNQLCGSNLPAQIEAGIAQDAASQKLTQDVIARMAAAVSQPELGTSYFRLMMQLRERRIDRWRFFTRLAFTPGPGEWQAVKLPRALFPLYRLVRLARLASRFRRR